LTVYQNLLKRSPKQLGETLKALDAFHQKSAQAKFVVKGGRVDVKA